MRWNATLTLATCSASSLLTLLLPRPTGRPKWFQPHLSIFGHLKHRATLQGAPLTASDRKTEMVPTPNETLETPRGSTRRSLSPEHGRCISHFEHHAYLLQPLVMEPQTLKCQTVKSQTLNPHTLNPSQTLKLLEVFAVSLSPEHCRCNTLIV